MSVLITPKSRRIFTHFLFWTGVLSFYTLYFGSREDEYGQSFLFVALMLPITLATTYFLNYWLIPRYVMTRRYGWFALYLTYTILVSVYLELVLLVVLYITVSGYQEIFVGASVADQLEVMAGMYLVVLVAVSAQMWKRLSSSEELNVKLEEERIQTESRLRVAEMRLQNDTWQVRADRKTHRIAISDVIFVESIRDYVKIHRSEGVMVSKMKLSDAEKELSDAGFIRIHRSFLVNPAHIASWTSESVVLGEEILPIGRSYRKLALDALSVGDQFRT